MLGVPINFQKNQELSLENTFLKAARTRAERSWLRKKLLAATLCDQIMGEAIPSRLDDEYNCQVILTMSVRVDAIKDSAAVAELLQAVTKPLCVFQLTDGAVERYSYAIKRLSKTEPGEVVVECAHLTPEFSLFVPGTPGETWRAASDFSHVLNRTDKLETYREWSARAFIAARPHLFAGTDSLLESKGWYEIGFSSIVLATYQRLDQLAREGGQANLLKDKARINQEARSLLDRLAEMK